MRILTAVAALLLLTTFAPPALFSEPRLPPHAQLMFERVALNPDMPAQRAVGRLTYLGGWAIRSNDRRFGGISAMHVADGRVLALSDSGLLFRFALPGRDARGAVSIVPLPVGPGSALSKRDRDSEAMAVDGDRVWVAFERQNAVWRYRDGFSRGDSSAQPRAMAGWPANAGSEAIVRLRDGRFLLFSEGRMRPDGTSEVLLFAGDPAVPGTRARVLGHRAPAGYRITDAALLPDGRLALLHRKFSVMEGVAALVSLAQSAPGADGIIAGREIAMLAPPLTVDNMEALSVTRDKGRTILWIASDDNFNGFQRTLLMAFALAD